MKISHQHGENYEPRGRGRYRKTMEKRLRFQSFSFKLPGKTRQRRLGTNSFRVFDHLGGGTSRPQKISHTIPPFPILAACSTSYHSFVRLTGLLSNLTIPKESVVTRILPGSWCSKSSSLVELRAKPSPRRTTVEQLWCPVKMFRSDGDDLIPNLRIYGSFFFMVNYNVGSNHPILRTQ